MAVQEFRFDPGQILQPVLPTPLSRLEPVAFGASLTIVKGQAMAQKTSDAKLYPLNRAASDGTQNFKGFAQYSVATDAGGLHYPVFGGTTAIPSFFGIAQSHTDVYTGGVFDPNDLFTAATGTAVAEVDTITPTSPTTGDIYTVTSAGGDAASFTVGATQTAAAVVTGLTNAWNSNPVLKAIATPSGSGTLILTGTAANAGQPLGVTATAVGTGTVALVVTTAPVAAQQAEIDTFTASTPTTGDVYKLTITYPNNTTYVVQATVGATQTATAIDALLIAAWNADPIASTYAVASGTTTLILTGPAGSTLNVAGSVVGTGTIAKVVTKAALGRNINDILPGCPGARVLPSGYWEIP